MNLKSHFFVGLALIALFWPAAWLHWGVPGEYAFFPLWLGYILTMDGLVAWRRGDSILTRTPGHFLALFLISAPVWWVFEGGNNYTLNWHYLVDGDYSRLHVILESTIDFSTVIPAVFETASLFLTFDFVQRRSPAFHFRLSRHLLWLLMYIGAFMYLAVILLPTIAFPLLWVWLFLLVDPLNAMRGRASLLAQFAHGDYRRLVALACGVLMCAFFWEMWNFYSMPKWFYVVPYVGFLKIFEMPLLGYFGYIPFAWELYALYHLIFGVLRQEKETII